MTFAVVCYSPAASCGANFVSSQTEDAGNSQVPETTVGMTGRIDDLKVDGSELKAKAVEDKDSVVVRIADVQPHGELKRYSIEYWGMEPGVFDLRDFLVRVDEASTADLPPLLVQVKSVTVVENGQLNDLAVTEIPWVGGYRLWVALGAVAWVMVAIGIFTWGRKSKSAAVGEAAVQKPVTWAEKLEPLVRRSQSGEILPEEQASLERLLVAFWRDKLRLNDLTADAALEQIKEDPEAGVLLSQLELWLHSPNPERNVDIRPLLEPYRHATLG